MLEKDQAELFSPQTQALASIKQKVWRFSHIDDIFII